MLREAAQRTSKGFPGLIMKSYMQGQEEPSIPFQYPSVFCTISFHFWMMKGMELKGLRPTASEKSWSSGKGTDYGISLWVG